MRTPTTDESRFVAWAEQRGLRAVLDYSYREDGSAVETCDLCIEEVIGGQVHAYCLFPLVLSPYPEVWEHFEKLLRRGFDRYKEEKGLAESERSTE